MPTSRGNEQVVLLLEPLTLASSFASIVGLLGVFSSERRADEAATIDQYIAWLQSHRHEQLANLILDNADLNRALQSLLQRQHDEVITKLHHLDQVLTEVASHIDEFRPITNAIAVQSRLSEQAVSILRQLNQADASRFMELKGRGSDVCYQTMDGIRCNLQIAESRFIKDDLMVLCELGFLRLENNKPGERHFTITRAGVEVGG